MGKVLTAGGLKKQIEALKVGERLILESVPEDMYHASIGVGSTLLRAAANSMAHYKAQRDKDKEPSNALQKIFDLGSAAHCLVLEPELWGKKFILQPIEIKRRQGKIWDAFKADHADKTIINIEQQDEADAMATAVMDECGQYFIDGKPEVSYWYRHESGVILKARVDYLKGDAAIDLKTTKEESPEGFAKALKFRYDIQDALYRMVTDLADMVFVGVEKEAPHSVYLGRQGAMVRQRAEEVIERVLFKKLAFAIEMNDFPKHPLELVETELTAWEKEQLLPKQVS